MFLILKNPYFSFCCFCIWGPKKLLANPRSWRLTLCCLLKVLYFQLICWSLYSIWSDIYTWCEVEFQLHSFEHNYSLSQHILLKELFFPPRPWRAGRLLWGGEEGRAGPAVGQTVMSNFCAGPQLHAEEHAVRPGLLQVPAGSSQMPDVGGELQANRFRR